MTAVPSQTATLRQPADGLDETAAAAVRGIGIPPCPAILTGVMREMRAAEPNFRRVGALIETDVGLAATAVKTANSAFFGLPKPAATVHEALAFMGVRTVAQILTGLLLRQAFPVANSEAMAEFWERSANHAALAGKLAQSLRLADPGSAYTFGLFRDCGMAIMLRKFKGYAEVMHGHASDGLLFAPLETERFGMDHARVGHYLANSWHLPPVLCAAILHHHDAEALAGRQSAIEAPSMRLIAIGALADHIETSSGSEPDGETLLACKQLGVPAERLREIEAAAREGARP